MKQQNKHAASKVPNTGEAVQLKASQIQMPNHFYLFSAGMWGVLGRCCGVNGKSTWPKPLMQGKSGSYFVDIKLSILLLASRMLPVIFQCLAMGSMVIYGNQLCSLTPTPHSTPRNHETYGISMGISTYFWDHLGRWEQMTRPCVASVVQCQPAVDWCTRPQERHPNCYAIPKLLAMFFRRNWIEL